MDISKLLDVALKDRLAMAGMHWKWLIITDNYSKLLDTPGNGLKGLDYGNKSRDIVVNAQK